VRQEVNRQVYEQQQRLRRQASEAKVMARMQWLLESGDPILVAEAQAFQQRFSGSSVV
jgi:hypothetical protein